MKGHLEIVRLLLSLFWQNWWEEKGTVWEVLFPVSTAN